MFSLKIIDLCNINRADCFVVDQAFGLWQKTYSEILNESKEILDPDIFWRSKILSVLLSQDDLVGFHLYNVYDLGCESICQHSYIKQITFDKLMNIKTKSISTLMSCEYLTVDKKYRGKIENFSVSDLIISLSSQVFANSPWDAVIGISRTDYKIDQKSNSVGCKTYGDLKRHDINCKIVIATKDEISLPKNKELADMTQTIWTLKQNHSPWIQTNWNLNKRIAS